MSRRRYFPMIHSHISHPGYAVVETLLSKFGHLVKLCFKVRRQVSRLYAPKKVVKFLNFPSSVVSRSSNRQPHQQNDVVVGYLLSPIAEGQVRE